MTTLSRRSSGRSLEGSEKPQSFRFAQSLIMNICYRKLITFNFFQTSNKIYSTCVLRQKVIREKRLPRRTSTLTEWGPAGTKPRSRSGATNQFLSLPHHQTSPHSARIRETEPTTGSGPERRSIPKPVNGTSPTSRLGSLSTGWYVHYYYGYILLYFNFFTN